MRIDSPRGGLVIAGALGPSSRELHVRVAQLAFISDSFTLSRT